MGIKAFTVSKSQELVITLISALAYKGSVVVDVHFATSDEVWKDGWYVAPPK